MESYVKITRARGLAAPCAFFVVSGESNMKAYDFYVSNPVLEALRHIASYGGTLVGSSSPTFARIIDGFGTEILFMGPGRLV